MDYTQSPDFSTHAGTGHRMHDDDKPITTIWTADDANSVIWSLMEIVNAAGLTPQQFDPNVASSYKVLKAALDKIYAGRLIAIRKFTIANNGQAYAKSDGTNSVIVRVQAPGGGGGGSVTCGAGQTSIAGGGGAGGYGEGKFDAGFDGAILTIPDGGVGGAVGAPGATAATASFGALLSCTGGVGGAAGQVFTGTACFGSAVSGLASGENMQGYCAPPGAFGYVAGNGWFSGFGASALMGPGATGVGGTTPGKSAITGYGGGGGGAATGQSSAGQPGGKGAPAVIYVLELA